MIQTKVKYTGRIQAKVKYTGRIQAKVKYTGRIQARWNIQAGYRQGGIYSQDTGKGEVYRQDRIKYRQDVAHTFMIITHGQLTHDNILKT